MNSQYADSSQKSLIPFVQEEEFKEKEGDVPTD